MTFASLADHGIYPLFEEWQAFETFLAAHVARIKTIGDLRPQDHMLVAWMAGHGAVELAPPTLRERVEAESDAARRLARDAAASQGLPDDDDATEPFDPMGRIG